MALTPAERMKRYREKLKQNPEKHEKIKKKHTEYVKCKTKKIEELTEKEKEKQRKIWRNQKSKQKQKKNQLELQKKKDTQETKNDKKQKRNILMKKNRSATTKIENLTKTVSKCKKRLYRQKNETEKKVFSSNTPLAVQRKLHHSNQPSAGGLKNVQATWEQDPEPFPEHEMEDEVPEVCRTCLATGVRMYDVAARGLHDTFETVTGTQLLTSEQRPTQVCYVCWSQLQRFRAFCQMSRRADAYMTQLLIERRQITQQEVSDFHRLIKPKLNVKRNPLITLHTQEDPDECAIVEVKVEEDTEEEDKNISDYETEIETEIRSEVKTGTYVSDRENEMEESRSDFETEKEIKIEIDDIKIEEFDPLEAIKHTNVGDETCYCLQCAEGFPSQSELLKHAQNHAQKKLKQGSLGLNKKVISAKKNIKTEVESQSEFCKTLEFETQLATRVTRDHGFREVAQNSKRRKPNLLKKPSDKDFD